MERNEKNMKHKKKVKLSLIFEILAFLVLIILVVVLFFTQQNKESEKDSDVAAIQEEAEEELVDNFEELYGQLQDIIDTLPPKCKEIFILGCVEGYSYKEVAGQLGVSVNTVKTQIKVAYKKIKSELGNPDANFMVAVQSALFAGELFS